MSKKTKRKEKNKIAANKSKEKGKSKKSKDKSKAKSKEAPAKSKDLAGKKGSQKQWEILRKEYMGLAIKYQGIESRAVSLLDNVSQLQRESGEIKAGLAAENEKSMQARERVNNLEMQEKADQDELSALNQRLEEQARLTMEVSKRLGAVEKLASQGERLGAQIELLQAGKNEVETRVGGLAQGRAAPDSASRVSGPGLGGLTSKLDDAIQRLQETVGRNQVIEAWIETQNKADSDFSLRLGQQQERIQGLMDRAEKLDQAARKDTESYQVLEEQVSGLSGNLESTEKRLLDSFSLQQGQQQERLQALMDRAEKLDQAARKDAESYQGLQEQIHSLSASLESTEKRLQESGAELEEKSQRLNTEYSSLAGRYGRLAGGVLVAAALILILGAVGYWFMIDRLEQVTQATSLQIEQISERIAQQDRKLIDQEQQFTAALGDTATTDAAPGDLDTRLERFAQSQASMDTRLQQLGQGQEDIEQKVSRFGDEQDEIRMGLERTGSLLSTVATTQDELQAKLELIEQGSRNRLTRTAPPGYAGDKVRGRDWLLGLNPKHYTIQIAAAFDQARVSRIAAREELDEPMAIYTGEFRERDWYVLLYGEYLSIREAKAAIKGLPADILAGGPWIRNMSSVQGDMAD